MTIGPYSSPEQVRQTYTPGPLEFDPTHRQWSKRPEVRAYRRAMILWGAFVVAVCVGLIWWSASQ